MGMMANSRSSAYVGLAAYRMHKVSKLQYTKQQHTKEIHESIRLTMNLKLINKSSTFNWVRRARLRRYAYGVRPILAPLRHSSSNEVKREIL